eukprot:CAMPEP_0115542388 /NCGR_PEP_ID=MMETSP0271-20121206/90961_1 /TAXON_ID=71861 /ORGANISM="Scrippsiella trochoidea, Strain CCMP3099" /LENGTH=99 /DNA_ID=CAMNT_0002975499 /DNA_START=187 /DNA_END=486 /DNA_ORIENTATION=-
MARSCKGVLTRVCPAYILRTIDSNETMHVAMTTWAVLVVNLLHISATSRATRSRVLSSPPFLAAERTILSHAIGLNAYSPEASKWWARRRRRIKRITDK